MALRSAALIPGVLLLILAAVGLLLMVLPTREIAITPENTYGIVLDAGSSHTSMFIYKWPADKQNGTGIVTQHSKCNAKGGGISSYAGQPGGAAQSLDDCLKQAMRDIPEHRHHQTPLYLGATAGMRLLDMVNAAESQKILKEVKNKLQSFPFQFKNATILSGQAEGAYGWVTVNYLLENFAKYGFVGRWLNPGKETVGALDLGGASTQITFETSEKVEDSDNVMELTLYGRTYKLYTQSFLCYGQDQFKRRLLAYLIKSNGVKPKVSNPCYPSGFNQSVVLGPDVFDSPCTNSFRPAQFDRQMSVLVVGTGDYQSCRDNVTKMFSFGNCSYSRCSFNGIFQPGLRGSFMAFSAFYFTHKYVTRLSNMSFTSPSQMKQAIRILCSTPLPEMSKKLNQSEKYLVNACAVANFVQVLLIDGYHFDEHSLPSIRFEQKAGGASVGWALGYMLTLSNMVPAEALGPLKALPSGSWAGLLFIFIALLLIAVGFLVMIYMKRKNEAGMV